MTKSEIVDGVIELLHGHKSGDRGSIHQDPYKADFFKLFAAAYNAGGGNVLYADALAALVVARAPELAKGEVWKNLYNAWSEWTYAWDHAFELRR
jgi:hypothetical protein